MTDLEKRIIYNLSLMHKPIKFLTEKERHYIMKHFGQYNNTILTTGQEDK